MHPTLTDAINVQTPRDDEPERAPADHDMPTIFGAGDLAALDAHQQQVDIQAEFEARGGA